MPNAFLDLAHLLPVSGPDLNANNLEPQYRPGAISFMVDAFGFRVFMYGKNQNGSAVVQGELMSKPADVTATNIDSGTTTSVTKAATFTADNALGGLLYIDDNDDSAGAAPEGEVGIITALTAATATIDADRPFTVAAAANDEARVVHTFHFEDSADGDLAKDVHGVAVGVDGITDAYYGWLQSYGYCPDVVHSAQAVTANAGVEAGAAEVKVLAGGGEEVVGWQIGTHTADVVSTKSPVFLLLFGAFQVVTAP